MGTCAIPSAQAGIALAASRIRAAPHHHPCLIIEIPPSEPVGPGVAASTFRVRVGCKAVTRQLPGVKTAASAAMKTHITPYSRASDQATDLRGAPESVEAPMIPITANQIENGPIASSSTPAKASSFVCGSTSGKSATRPTCRFLYVWWNQASVNASNCAGKLTRLDQAAVSKDRRYENFVPS